MKEASRRPRSVPLTALRYADLTFEDSNPIKCWLQRRRLFSAVALCGNTFGAPPAAICDFGAGDGALCVLLAERYPESRIFCYEPTPALLAEARQRASGVPGIQFCQDIGAILVASLDVVFCLEVFEHLPPAETAEALQRIADLLVPGGVLILGVPVEIGIPALYKGLFRMLRRYGAYDACFGNVARAVVGRPPTGRLAWEIAPGFRFHHEHLGFDHRRLEQRLVRGSEFRLLEVAASPFAALGTGLMPEVYFVASKLENRLGPSEYDR